MCYDMFSGFSNGCRAVSQVFGKRAGQKNPRIGNQPKAARQTRNVKL